MIEVVEKFESRYIDTGEDPRVELLYNVFGTTDDVEAYAALVNASPPYYAPTSLLIVARKRATLRRVGPQLWEGVVQYGAYGQLELPGESSFAFDTGGGTQHITQSLQTVALEAPPGKSAPNFKGAIGATQHAVEGVDIVVPVYQFSETHYLLDALVTEAYKITLSLLTGKVNEGLFKGFEMGECLFLGASGSKRGTGDWEIGFRFAASPNVTDLTIGDITGVNKKGWEYLWVRYMDATDEAANAPVKIPQAAYVERVYEYGDFTLLGL